MAADRARLTYTPTRQYREVVTQQGRVTLEADVNEASRIASEAARLAALEVVGPAGTPDDGYAVAPTGDGRGLSIGPGTMYAGGLRLTLETDVLLSAQPDWTDNAADPLWREPNDIGGNAALALLAVEHEITAEEDPALREVALGGPDSAARTRILQHFLLLPGDAASCAAAAADIAAFWAARGRAHLEAAATLEPRARLRITALGPTPAASPCDLPEQTGYLGADNQLIRVQITAFDAATGAGRLLWGWNNASTLYRCTVRDNTTLQLARRPVGPEFAPAANQAVQLLLPAADLGEGAVAAAITGHVATLAAPYQPDTRLVTLPSPMPAPYHTPPPGRKLFLRLWQAEQPFTLGTEVALTGTGLAVTITAAVGNSVSIGDYWSIGVRPKTPNQVYPERLLAAPQPPDGPRTWLCPLALVRREQEQWQLLEDCRRPFDNLVELAARQPGHAACCCVTVEPGQAAELQNIIEKVSDTDTAGSVIRFAPGTYELPRPLVITKRHRGLVLESCSGGRVLLRAADAYHDDFSHGLIILDRASSVTLRGLDLLIPDAPIPGKIRDLNGERDPKLGRMAVGLHIVGGPSGAPVRADSPRDITVERCAFLFEETEPLLGAGILARDQLVGFRVRDSRFAAESRPGPPSLAAGILVVPTAERDGTSPIAPQPLSLAIEGNSFAGLSFGVAVAGVVGDLDIAGNVAGDCFCPVMVVNLPVRPNQWRFSARSFSAAFPQDQGSMPTKAFNEAFLSDERVFALMERAPFLPSLAEPQSSETPSPAMRLDVSGNRLVSPGTVTKSGKRFVGESSGPALYIADFVESRAGSATIARNTCANHSLEAPTAMVVMLGRLAITGNLLTNEAPDPGPPDKTDNPRLALLVVPGGRVQPQGVHAEVTLMAVTGNTMLGRSNLDSWVRQEWKNRLASAALPITAWDFFNTEV